MDVRHRVADGERFRLCNELFQKFVVDAPLEQQPRPAVADRALIEEHVAARRVHCVVHPRCVCEDEVRRFAAKLQSHARQVFRCAAHHAAPHIRGAGEGHAVDQRTFCQRRTDDRSLAGDHVERPV